MTDKELLELAAKAAGVDWQDNPDLEAVEPISEKFDLLIKALWNPLTDDGDALRLAVKLKIDVCSEYWNDDESVQAQNDNGDICVEQKGLDPYAATRRAIVRAAAEVGRTM